MSVEVCMPTGEAKWIPLGNNMSVQQLRKKVINETRQNPGFKYVREDDVSLTLGGQTLENSRLLSECRILPSSVIHLVLRVHGG